jgi:hypothetical protein
MQRHVLLVHSNPAPGREDEYNAWYDDEHLEEVLAVPGFVAARRYRVADAEQAATTEYRYIAAYEIHGDLQGAMKRLGEAVEARAVKPSPTMQEPHLVVLYELIAERLVEEPSAVASPSGEEER